MAGWPALFAPAIFLLSVVVPSHAGDIEAGKKKSEACLACHGEGGISATPNVPNLAGQTDQYIEYQLVYFRNNQRKNELMQPMVAQLSDDDVRNLGAYLATFAAPKAPAGQDTDAKLTETGKKIAAQRRCSACHGETFEGLQAAPRLAWQREEYLASSLQSFRDGKRPSAGVGAMSEAAAGLSDDDAKALGHYLAFFKGAK